MISFRYRHLHASSALTIIFILFYSTILVLSAYQFLVDNFMDTRERKYSFLIRLRVVRVTIWWNLRSTKINSSKAWHFLFHKKVKWNVHCNCLKKSVKKFLAYLKIPTSLTGKTYTHTGSPNSTFTSVTDRATVEVDPVIWQAIAGSSVQIPPVNSYVYYFTQGHIENFSANSIQKCNLHFYVPSFSVNSSLFSSSRFLPPINSPPEWASSQPTQVCLA